MVSENQWVYDLPLIIYSYIKRQIEKKHPAANVTDLDSSLSEPIFPTVYVKELEGKEKGRGLEGKKINAVEESFQVDVICNTSKNDARIIMATIMDSFKKLQFEVLQSPLYSDKNKVYRGIARFRRIIGANDTL